MQSSSAIVSSNILDIGTRQYDNENKQRSAGAAGTSGLCPPDLVLGMPGAFDVPNVADVSRSSIRLHSF